ncbi:MAG: PIN domain-containing protein [Bryobacterales bacterium]|nr:PIN domain-containing protein [Bryobacterales bacterium]
MIVLDASAAVELLGATPRGQAVLRRLLGEPVLHAPHLLDVEVLSAIRRQAALGGIAEERAARALALFQDLRILRYPHHPFLKRIWQLRHNFSVYDSCYLAVTEVLGATLLTCDKALAAARLQRGAVEVI